MVFAGKDRPFAVCTRVSAADGEEDDEGVIPNVFHFCFGLAPQAEFGFLEYLAIKSAREINRPQRIYLHYRHECRGPWWQRAKRLATLERIEPPTAIHGRPLLHYAHQCDVLRLLALRQYGGIYLDIDTLCVRPFSDLLDRACVMGTQRDRGLCNAVILSEPQGTFVNAWLDSYRSFRSAGRDEYWDEHSVIVPRRLADTAALGPHISVVDQRAFFYPLWNEMPQLFESSDPAPFAGSYCIHYWETMTRQRWLRGITAESAARGDSNFARFVRQVL